MRFSKEEEYLRQKDKKLKKIINTFNNIDKNLAYEDIKKLSTKYHKNINVLNVLSQIAQKMGDVDTTINSLKKIEATSYEPNILEETFVNYKNFKGNWNAKNWCFNKNLIINVLIKLCIKFLELITLFILNFIVNILVVI